MSSAKPPAAAPRILAGIFDKLSSLSARSGGAERRAACRTIAGSHSGATTGVARPAAPPTGVVPKEEKLRRRQSPVRAKAEGEAVLHADTGTTDVSSSSSRSRSRGRGRGVCLRLSSEECYDCGAMAMQCRLSSWGWGKDACGFKRKAGGRAGGRAGWTDGLPVGVGVWVWVCRPMG